MEQRERRLRNQHGQLIKGFEAMLSVMLLTEEASLVSSKVQQGHSIENRMAKVRTVHPNCWDYTELCA